MKEKQLDLSRRPRRYRASRQIRSLLTETQLTISDLICPLFIQEKKGKEEIGSMPGIFRYSLENLLEVCSELREKGINAVALFPCVPKEKKDDSGSLALDPEGLIPKAVSAIKKNIPELLVITDVALDPYTTHGHDGLWNEQLGDVDNDATVEILTKMAVMLGKMGADFVAPSDMMDGRVGQIRKALDSEGLTKTGILAYSAKFASAFYGPFREAVGSARKRGYYLDKMTYQLNPSNRREACLEALLDEKEGADILMVKPAGPYLDIIYQIRQNTLLPVAAYQVSGEYSAIVAAGLNGWLDPKKAAIESLVAIKRAGADIILTYFAQSLAKDPSFNL
ncbi:delta-aminolevulinic acid dehydratase [Methylacidiphilum kamchatkense Kam1]|uniref:Delta-aminolevulinic acid dehydratase n=1 Tax=Methylacidiphilum kamchatkense Kam1 TaxID=1202785 RepID=A0A0C1RSK7_9BACT|nr:porphobilinogen synthase [Methylacidiphilum kamchatkense]KIE57916.1 delta-aminolevulinic acid dehydratase [Methylacidiphilum kamchatkense Kam1]QDQ42343.1 porphobilinogen synthase [Methylacidiphilum kamchatkense Kam1]